MTAALLSGCSLINRVTHPNATRSASPVPSQAPPSDSPAGLERFYAQQLAWAPCSGGECATMTVPMDYSAPDGKTLDIAVFRLRATGARQGSLLVNPGGPGASGISYARAASAGWVVSPSVLRSFDIVGFDPRGVGDSSSITCLAPDRLDAFFAQDPTPDDPAEELLAAKMAAEFGRSCVKNSPGLAEHISTVEAARDMDILRARLGDPKLNYLGKSYGTLLGATYAGLFPQLVGRMVLDGALPPDLTSQEVNQGQAEGFERATRAWAQDCIDSGCPLGTSVDQVMAGLRAFLLKLDSAPLTRTGDATVPAVTEGWASYAVAAAMYDQGRWADLTAAIKAGMAGDGTQLLELANTYTDRIPGGGYADNMQEAFYAITCLDKGESPDLGERQAEAERVSKVAPTFGSVLVWSSLPCGYWPRPASAPQGAPAKVAATGSGPIVVVGTTRDPATPYEWAQRLADQLDNGVLLSFDGDGHTAYLRSGANSCIDKAVDAWFLKGTVPQDGLRC